MAVLTALRHYGRCFSLHQYNVAVKDFRYCNTFETAILLLCMTIDVVLSGQDLMPASVCIAPLAHYYHRGFNYRDFRQVVNGLTPSPTG